MDKPINKTVPKSANESSDQLFTTEVTAVLLKTTISGQVQFREQQRVSDYFNKGIVGTWQKSDHNFITFLNASVTDINGIVIFSAPHLFVAKENILFVMETAGINAAHPKENESSAKSHPFRNKEPLKVTMSVPNFLLEGTVYRESQQPLNIMLEQENPFIPITGISIEPALSKTIRTAKFSAVNKTHILYLSER
jgi:hypothetical protein